ncbi:MAG: hypothetical protein ABID79_02630 [Elusimicrobiota bacterium]
MAETTLVLAVILHNFGNNLATEFEKIVENSVDEVSKRVRDRKIE